MWSTLALLVADWVALPAVVDVCQDQAEQNHNLSACRAYGHHFGSKAKAARTHSAGTVLVLVQILSVHLHVSTITIFLLQGPETQRLYLGRNMLEDARQLADLKVENDDVLALTYQQPGVCIAAAAHVQLCHNH